MNISRLVRKGVAGGMPVWEVVRGLQELGIVSRKILPRWVYRCTDGLYRARVKSGVKPVGDAEGEGFACPVEAHDDLRRRLGLPPLGSRPVGPGRPEKSVT